jgi:hypothetical protein
VDPTPKLEVNHLVLEESLSLYNQDDPLDERGRFEYLPVPSSHDFDIGNTSIDCSDDKFLCSVENNCKLEVKLLDLPIAFWISVLEN